MCACVYVHVCVHVYLFVCLCVCVWACVLVCIFVYTCCTCVVLNLLCVSIKYHQTMFEIPPLWFLSLSNLDQLGRVGVELTCWVFSHLIPSVTKWKYNKRYAEPNCSSVTKWKYNKRYAEPSCSSVTKWKYNKRYAEPNCSSVTKWKYNKRYDEPNCFQEYAGPSYFEAPLGIKV